MRYLISRSAERLLTRCLALLMLLSLGVGAQSAERIRYFINDPSGSPVQVLDADGAVVARYAYAPFGSQLAVQGAANQRLGFVGGIRETASLHYLKHRYYNPMLGRFYQPDPVGFLSGGTSQINRYGYGMNDPYRYRDASGMQSVGEQLEDAALRNIAQGDSVNGYLLTVALTGWNLFGAENISQVYDKRGDVSTGTYAVATLEAVPLLGTVKYLKVATGSSAIRTTYVKSIDDLVGMGQSMRAAGTTAEQTVRTLSPLRNQLKLDLRAEGSWFTARAADFRNLIKYGNRAGPSADDLYRQYGSWEKALEAMERTNSAVNRMLGVTP